MDSYYALRKPRGVHGLEQPLQMAFPAGNFDVIHFHNLSLVAALPHAYALSRQSGTLQLAYHLYSGLAFGAAALEHVFAFVSAARKKTSRRALK